MRRSARGPGRVVLLASALTLGTHHFSAAAPLIIRGADHPGFGRIELELPEGMTAMAAQRGDRVFVHFLSGTPFDRVDPGLLATRNLRSSIALADGIELTVTHGARLKVTPLGDRLVLDLLDPLRQPDVPGARGPAPPAPDMRPDVVPAAMNVTASPSGATLAPPVSPPAILSPPAPAPVGSTPDGAANRVAVHESAEAREVTRSELPEVQKPPPTPLALAATVTGSVLSLPFSAATGAASFKRGEWSYVVFDERRPIDLSRQGEGTAFAQATMLPLPDATLLRFKAEPGAGLSLAHDGAEWRITLDGARPHGIKPRPVADGLLLPAADIGRVVAIPDPDGGGALLVGTLRQAGGAVPVGRRATAFALWPTWLGVVVEPALDTTWMHAVPDGFLLTAGVGRGLGLSDAFAAADPAAAADDPTRQLALPALATEMLLARLREATLAASVAPAQSRTEKRLAVAQSLLALGLGAEAQGVTAAAARDDPRASARPDLIAVAAIGALLAGRVGEADGIMDQHLADTDEVELWRGIRAAMLGQDTRAAAAILAPTFGLLASYPAPLRDRLMALVGETLAAGEQGAALDKLGKALPDDRHLGLARAMAADAGAPALAALGSLAHDPDRRVRAKAAQLATEARLARGLVDVAGTADALEHLLYAWRDDRSEVALRERVAELRARGGAPRPALALLRETSRLWPDHAVRLRQRMAGMLAAAAAPDAWPSLPPLAFVAMVRENADLLPEGRPGERLADMLADRLEALDLAGHAATVLGKLVGLAPPGAARATLGGRLARSRLAQGDAPGALAALRDSDAPGLPVGLLEARELLRAEAQAAQNDRVAALQTLAPLTGLAALALRATLLERGREWAAAGQALDAVLDAAPPAGPLDEAQAKILLRTASDAAQAGDAAKLQRLQQRFGGRMPGPDLASVFAMLTVAPVREVADLARARREAALARRLPGQLDAIAPGRIAAR